MDTRELLGICQGKMTQEEFATLLGITQPAISKYLAGTRKPDWKTWAALMRVFPERRDSILSVFLCSNYGKTHDDMDNAMNATAALVGERVGEGEG